EKNGEVDVVFRLRIPERKMDGKSFEFFSVFLEGFYKGLTSMALDSVVTSEFRGCGYEANCCEFTLHAKRTGNADQERMNLQWLNC
ncbi:MAG: hypothetical protein ACE5PO_06205, partial [Candidatus Bathyarchaeia archaeon]